MSRLNYCDIICANSMSSAIYSLGKYLNYVKRIVTCNNHASFIHVLNLKIVLDLYIPFMFINSNIADFMYLITLYSIKKYNTFIFHYSYNYLIFNSKLFQVPQYAYIIVKIIKVCSDIGGTPGVHSSQQVVMVTACIQPMV